MEWNENETVLALFVPNICTLNTATSKPDFQNMFFFLILFAIYLESAWTMLFNFFKYNFG